MAQAASGETVPAALSSEDTLAARPGEGCHILVAEDHPINRKFLGAWLEKLGHRVQFAVNGLEALERVQAEDFDLVFMDIHMPDMDGLASTRQIRALKGPRSRTPIVALSADILKETEEAATAAGVDQFLAKPVNKAQLQATLARWTQGVTLPAPLD